MVLAHARALLDDNPVTAVAPGDLRDPAGILAQPALRGQFRPVLRLACADVARTG